MTIQTVLMPDTEGSNEVIEFCIELGDQVDEGDSLLVLESDKASIEVPAPTTGTIKQWLVEIGAQVTSGTPLAELEPDAEASVAAESEPKPEPVENIEQPDTAPSVPPTKPAPKTAVAPENVSSNTSIRSTASAEVNAGPSVRKLARELGIDLSKVPAKAKHGRILKEDVKAFAKRQLTQTEPQLGSTGSGIPPIPQVDFSRYGDVEHQNLSSIAKATVAHMRRCWLNIPHVTLFDEVNIDDVEAFRQTLDPDALGLPRKPTLVPFLIAIIARALKEFPQFNASLDPSNDQIIQKSYINVGFAVDSPAGLVVPVIRDADKMSIRDLTIAVSELSTKARERKLTAADMQGGCFTLSSMGALGGTGFTPIINGPEVAILGVAKSAIKPIWNGKEFIPAKQLPLCLSFDHRAINGGDAGRFMAYIHKTLSDIRNALL